MVYKRTTILRATALSTSHVTLQSVWRTDKLYDKSIHPQVWRKRLWQGSKWFRCTSQKTWWFRKSFWVGVCTVPAHFADDEIGILNNVRTIMYSRLTRISKTVCFAQWLKALLHGPHMSKAVDHTSSRTWNWTTLYLMCTSSVTQPNRKSGYPYNVHVMHIFAIVLNRNYRNSWELRRSAS